jgi:hypothetical protein
MARPEAARPSARNSCLCACVPRNFFRLSSFLIISQHRIGEPCASGGRPRGRGRKHRLSPASTRHRDSRTARARRVVPTARMRRLRRSMKAACGHTTPPAAERRAPAQPKEEKVAEMYSCFVLFQVAPEREQAARDAQEVLHLRGQDGGPSRSNLGTGLFSSACDQTLSAKCQDRITARRRAPVRPTPAPERRRPRV